MRRTWVGIAVAACISRVAWSDDQGSAAQGSAAATETEQTQREIAAQEEPEESDLTAPPPRKILENWNEYDLHWLTFKWGLFTIEDFGRAAQSDSSEALIDVPSGYKIRDFRLTFSGQFKTKRKLTYTMGLMYDGPSASWFPRETGIQVAIPELWGNIFFGRQKEGISLEKITVGYAVWVMERSLITDTIPILADGVKWLGVHPSKHANWNVAYFRNQLPKSPAKDQYLQAVVARLCWVPLHPAESGEGDLLHLGVAYHWGQFPDDEAQLKSRPESFTAPFFLDTGMFPANTNHMIQFEAYYRHNNWLGGAEYLLDYNRAPQVGNPMFHGGFAFVSWAVTGEIRPYIDIGGKIGFLEPKYSKFSGGPGALEAVLNFSYADYDDAGVSGGKFWRLTPQLNWYLDNMVSIRFNYGLGHLDLNGQSAFTNFFQARVQFQID